MRHWANTALNSCSGSSLPYGYPEEARDALGTGGQALHSEQTSLTHSHPALCLCAHLGAENYVYGRHVLRFPVE